MKLIKSRSSTEVLTRKTLVVKLDDGTKIICVDLFDSDGDIVETFYRYEDGDEVSDPILLEELTDFTSAVYDGG